MANTIREHPLSATAATGRWRGISPCRLVDDAELLARVRTQWRTRELPGELARSKAYAQNMMGDGVSGSPLPPRSMRTADAPVGNVVGARRPD